MTTIVAIDKSTTYHDDTAWGWAGAVSKRSGNAGFRSYEEAIVDALRNHPDYAETIVCGRLARINDDPMKLVIVDPVLVNLATYGAREQRVDDHEVEAMRRLLELLEQLPEAARLRVLRWAQARFEPDRPF